jgi:hypothetical protein
MKIEQTTVSFKPITVTFETEAELAFFVRALGAASGNIDCAFNINSGKQLNNYNSIHEIVGFDVMEKYPKLHPLSVDYSI